MRDPVPSGILMVCFAWAHSCGCTARLATEESLTGAGVRGTAAGPHALGAVLYAGLPGRPRLDAGLVGDEALAGHAQHAVRRALDLLVQLRACAGMTSSQIACSNSERMRRSAPRSCASLNGPMARDGLHDPVLRLLDGMHPNGCLSSQRASCRRGMHQMTGDMLYRTDQRLHRISTQQGQ